MGAAGRLSPGVEFVVESSSFSKTASEARFTVALEL
jgi:hypothetical protein